MPLPGIQAARFMVEEMQRDLLETEDQHLDGFFARWKAAGLPEIGEYEGERLRSRGEMISELNKIDRAIEQRPELLQEEDTGESPIPDRRQTHRPRRRRVPGLDGKYPCHPALHRQEQLNRSFDKGQRAVRRGLDRRGLGGEPWTRTGGRSSGNESN